MAITLPGLVSYHLVGDKLVPRVSCEDPTTGDIPYYDSVTGKWVNLAAGTATHVLTSNGPGTAPSYQPVGGSSYTNTFGKTIFVDGGHERAQDSPRTGSTKYNMNVPYATIAAAMTAAASGDTILLYPGTQVLGATLTVKDGVNIFGFGNQSRIQGRVEFTAGSTGINLYSLSIQNTGDLCLFGNVANTIRIEQCEFLSSYTTQVTKFTIEFSQGTIRLVQCFIRLTSSDTGVTINNAGLLRISGTTSLILAAESCNLEYTSADDDDETRLIYDTNTNTTTTIRILNCRSDFSNTSAVPISLHHFYYASSHTSRRDITNNFCNFSWTSAGTNNFLVFIASISGGSGGSLNAYDNTVVWSSNLPDTSVYLGRASVANDIINAVNNNLRYSNGFFVAPRYYLAGDLGTYNILSISDSTGVQIGRPDARKQLDVGEGGYSSDGMVVFTTNNTASGVSDGGGFVDQTLQATSETGTFSFQGTTANHTILIGSELQTSAGYLKYWGFLISQTTAAVEVTKRSFAFEVWDGAAWVAVNSMAFQKTNTYRYGNEVFIRANNTECVNLGIDPDNTTWVTKTINGRTAFFARIRITANLTTAPVFNYIKLARSTHTIENFGIQYFTGVARYFDYYIGPGAWGVSGTVDGNFAAGSGGSPTGWTHQTRQARLNGDGDFVNANIRIPSGVDTSLPVQVEAIFETSTASTTTATLTVSFLPVEVKDNFEADPTGGIVPVQRTEANTELVTAKVAQTATASPDNTPAGYFRRASFTGYNVANYYEGDMVLLRFQLTTRNSGVIELLSLSIRFGKTLVGENFNQR